MIKELEIEGKVVSVYSKENCFGELPVVILHTYGNEGKEVFEKCIEIGCENFILVSISNLDWNNDMSPWFALKLNEHGEDFLGKADEYIEVFLKYDYSKCRKIFGR